MFHHDITIIDFAFTSHFSPAFLQEISPGSFLFLHGIQILHSDNFSMKQEICVFNFTSTVA